MASDTARPNGIPVMGLLSAIIDDSSRALVWSGLLIHDVAVSVNADLDLEKIGLVALAPSAHRGSPQRSMLSNTRPAQLRSLPAGSGPSGRSSHTNAVSTSERGKGSRRAMEPSSSHAVRWGTRSSPIS